MILEAKRKSFEEIKEQEGTGSKILTPKQMLQTLPIGLARVKVGNNSESLLNQTNCLFLVSFKRNHKKRIQ